MTDTKSAVPEPSAADSLFDPEHPPIYTNKEFKFAYKTVNTRLPGLIDSIIKHNTATSSSSADSNNSKSYPHPTYFKDTIAPKLVKFRDAVAKGAPLPAPATLTAVSIPGGYDLSEHELKIWKELHAVYAQKGWLNVSHPIVLTVIAVQSH
jgi:hypothetical protein